MRELTNNELAAVSAGDLTCTGGTSGFNCTGSVQDWINAFNTVLDRVSDFIDELFG